MKYIVEVKYTNPAHEHVSLRRRVETVRRVVEAATEAEALNRVANQQRSLGFMIKEAEVVHNGGEGGAIITNNEPKKKKVVGDEGETEIKKEPVKEADSKRYMRPVENQLPAGLDKPKKNPEETKKEPVKEETVDEDRAMSAAIAGGSVGSKILTGKMDPNFGYAANKMPPHLKAAQAKSDALSKVTKRPQAGTLAAKKANEEVEDKKPGKGRKAAERMINLAKSKKNQVNLEPSVDPYKHNQSPTGK